MRNIKIIYLIPEGFNLGLEKECPYKITARVKNIIAIIHSVNIAIDEGPYLRVCSPGMVVSKDSSRRNAPWIRGFLRYRSPEETCDKACRGRVWFWVLIRNTPKKLELCIVINLLSTVTVPLCVLELKVYWVVIPSPMRVMVMCIF